MPKKLMDTLYKNRAGGLVTLDKFTVEDFQALGQHEDLVLLFARLKKEQERTKQDLTEIVIKLIAAKGINDIEELAHDQKIPVDVMREKYIHMFEAHMAGKPLH